MKVDYATLLTCTFEVLSIYFRMNILIVLRTFESSIYDSIVYYESMI